VTKQAVVLRAEEDPQRRQALAVPDLVDQRLDFGDAQIASGKAFIVGEEVDPDRSQVVVKDWVTLPDAAEQRNRTFLIESVEFPAIEPWLKTLPGVQAAVQRNTPQAVLARRQPKSRSDLIAAIPFPKSLRDGKAKTKVQMAKITSNAELSVLKRRPGVVLDYNTLNANQTNTQFTAENTYYVNGTANLYGTNLF